MSEPLPSPFLPSPTLRADPVISIRLICEAVAAHYGIQTKQLFGAVRRVHFALPRQVVMHLAYVHSNRSLPAIGRLIGRDHTTVFYAHTKIATMRVADAAFDATVRALETTILSCAAALINRNVAAHSDINATDVARRIVDSATADTLVSTDEIRAMAQFILSTEMAEQPPLPPVNSTTIQETRA